MSLVADLKRFKAKAMEQAGEIKRQTILEFSNELVTIWSPYGNPELWKSQPPPKDYIPGHFRSSWFLSVGAPSTETTEATDITKVNHLERLDDGALGATICLSNNAPHAGALEGGHSKQAQLGLLVNAYEFEAMAYATARRIAG